MIPVQKPFPELPKRWRCSGVLKMATNGGGMKSWGFKEINFRTDTMIIISTNHRETTHAPIFYTVCYAPFLFFIL